MRGRPRLFERSFDFHFAMEWGAYQTLTGPMLAEYRRTHPRARSTDLVRHVFDQAIAGFAAGTAGRDGARQREHAQRIRQIRKLATAAVQASDEKIEVHVRRLAALVETSGSAA